MNMQEEAEKKTLSVVEPPSGNTGVLPTNKSGLRSLIDWVSFTLFRGKDDIDFVMSLLNVNYADFMQIEGKMMGYNSHLHWQGITIHYNGREDMGLHVEISGQGCRNYENGNGKYGRSWDELFMDILDFGGHFTRLDVAIDDFKGYFSIPRLVKQIKSGRLVSKFRWVRVMENIHIKDGKTKGVTIYYGRSSGEIQVRMYEKDHERRANGHDVMQKVTCWNRTEIQARNLRAQQIAKWIVSGEYPLGLLVSGILKEYLRFVDKKEGDTNKHRWPTSRFWEKFLGQAEKISLSLVAPDMTIERKTRWILDQTSKTLVQVWYAFENHPDLLQLILDNGYLKMDEKDWQLAEEFRKFGVRDDEVHKLREEIEKLHKQKLEEELKRKKNNPRMG